MADTEAVLLGPEQPAATLIWLHGLGADGHDFEPLFRDWTGLAGGLRVELPHAPPRPVTVNNGMTIRAWYDITSPALTEDVDWSGIEASAQQIGARVRQAAERCGDSRRVVLGGFSQGAVMALWTGLGLEMPLGGLAALSGYLPGDPEVAEAQRSTPLFLAHGQSDPLIPFELGQSTCDRLPALGTGEPEWHAYAMEHTVSEAEAGDLQRWLLRVLPT
jgi:phospholipase/carboxylesterase